MKKISQSLLVLFVLVLAGSAVAQDWDTERINKQIQIEDGNLVRKVQTERKKSEELPDGTIKETTVLLEKSETLIEEVPEELSTSQAKNLFLGKTKEEIISERAGHEYSWEISFLPIKVYYKNKEAKISIKNKKWYRSPKKISKGALDSWESNLLSLGAIWIPILSSLIFFWRNQKEKNKLKEIVKYFSVIFFPALAAFTMEKLHLFESESAGVEGAFFGIMVSVIFIFVLWRDIKIDILLKTACVAIYIGLATGKSPQMIIGYIPLMAVLFLLSYLIVWLFYYYLVQKKKKLSVPAG